MASAVGLKVMKDEKNELQFHAEKILGAFHIVELLKSCAKQKDLGEGSKLHSYAWEHKLDGNCYISSTLVSLYTRCGALPKAQELLDELPVRHLVTWNALIAGYTQQGRSEEALMYFNYMQWEGHSPNAVTCMCALKACRTIGAAAEGEKIHDKIVSWGMLLKDSVLGSTLVDMYVRCGELVKARQLLDELPFRDVVTWTALIAGYTQLGQSEEAVKCFDSMQQEGHSPDEVAFTCALSACGNLQAVTIGENIHHKIVCFGMLEKHTALGNTLVVMYARCGKLATAQQVFSKLPVRTTITWNTLIAGYAQQGKGKEALTCFDNMEREGHSPDAVTFISVLKICGDLGAVEKGENIHYKIVSLGISGTDNMLGSALVDMYARCGALVKAQHVLDELPVRNVVMWTAVIAGYVQQGQDNEAVECFDIMLCEGHSPDGISLLWALNGCASIGLADKGEEIHDKIINLGVLENDIVLRSTLVDTYARFGALTKAKQIFDELPVRDVFTWTALIGGYIQHGQSEEGLKCFDSMEREGHRPDSVTFMYVLKACGNIGATSKGQQIHDKIVVMGLLDKEIVLGGALVDMYAQCSALAKAAQVVTELPVRNVVVWTSLIAGYVQHGQGEDALKCLDSMEREGHSPDTITLIYALKACGSIGAAVRGEQIHGKIVSLGLGKYIALGGILVDMYAKCAALAKAAEVHKELPVRNVITWNALISGYAQLGQSGKALNCFEKMQHEGVRPDSTTLVCVLNACSHSGLLDQGTMYFLRLSEYGITPDVEHYCCMVDLFSCAGGFTKALVVIEKMPSVNYLPIWLALLSACRQTEDAKIGRFAFECAVRLDKNVTAAYVCMANACTEGLQDACGV